MRVRGIMAAALVLPLFLAGSVEAQSAKPRRPKITYENAAASGIDEASFASALVACNAGQVIGGGGYFSGGDNPDGLSFSDASDQGSGATEGFGVIGTSIPEGTPGHASIGVSAVCATRATKLKRPRKTISVPGGQQLPVTVRCPAGTKVIGGGGGIRGGSDPINTSAPIDGGDPDKVPDDGWVIYADNTDVGARNETVEAFCAPKSFGQPVYRSRSFSTPADSAAPTAVSCPSATHVTGGGGLARIGYGAALLHDSYPFDGNDTGRQTDDGWVGGIRNYSVSTVSSKAFAICLHPPAG